MKFNLKAINVQTIIDVFNGLDLKVRFGIMGIGILSFVILDYALIMQFQIRAMDKMNGEIKQLGEDIERVKADKQRITQIKQGLEGTRTQFKAVADKIRSLADVPMVLEEISTVATASRVTLDVLNPSKEGQEHAFTIGEAKYYFLPVVINAHSGYHMFGKFLNELESANLLFIIKDLRMDNSGKEGSVNLAIGATLKVLLVDKAGGG